MKFCPDILDETIEKIENKTLLYENNIIIGDNASGKSELIKRMVERKISKGERIYFIDSVNRYFDVSKVDNSLVSIEDEKNIVRKRMGIECFNVVDSFSMYGTATESVEMIYSKYEQQVQEMLRNFCGISFNITFPKEKLVKYNDGLEGKVSNGIQALVRIFVELQYLNSVLEDEQIIVVIDELDEFLSPANAAKIFPFLVNNFSQMKFVISTHSSDIVRTAENCNVIILHRNTYEVIDSNDFDSEGDVQLIFQRLFGEKEEQKDEIEQKLRILLNNKMMGAWGKNDDMTFDEIKEENLSNAQKILYRRIKEW